MTADAVRCDRLQLRQAEMRARQAQIVPPQPPLNLREIGQTTLLLLGLRTQVWHEFVGCSDLPRSRALWTGWLTLTRAIEAVHGQRRRLSSVPAQVSAPKKPPTRIEARNTVAQMLDNLSKSIESLAQIGVPWSKVLDHIEKAYMESAVKHCNHNQMKAAKHIGVHRNTILRIVGPEKARRRA